MKKGDLKYPDRDFLNRKEKLQEELIQLEQELDVCKRNVLAGYEAYQADVEIRERIIEKTKSQLAELKEEEKDPNVVCDQYHMRGKWIKEEEPKQSAEEILERYAEGINEDGSPYLSNKSIIKAMEEYRQQGRPTEEEIGYKADEHSEFIGVGGIKNNNIARQVSFMQGARWAINKWKGE